MCKSDKKRDEQKTTVKHKRRKKKLTCCQKCQRKCCKWLCNKIKRCVKRKIFGDPNPYIDEFEVAGINLGSVKEKLGIGEKKSSKKLAKKDDITPKAPVKSKKKFSVVTLFRNVKIFSTKSIPVKEALVDELERYSLMKLKGNRLKSIVEDFKERDLVFGLSKDSKLKITKSEMEQIKNYNSELKKYKDRASLRKISLLEKMNADEFKKKFSLSKSKSKILKNFIKDYKKGKSVSNVVRKSNISKKQFSKTDINAILDNYRTEKEKKDRTLVENIHHLSKKLSLTGSKAMVLTKMVEDFKNRKFSLTSIPNKSKLNVNDPNIEDLNKMLDYYQEHHMKKERTSFIKQSKLKQIKSDIRAKFNY